MEGAFALEEVGEILELLGRSFLFQGTGATARALDDVRCVRTQVVKGAEIYTPRVFQRSLGIILSGMVQVSKEDLIVSVLEPGEIFGAAALFHQGEDYVTTLTARTDCDLVFLPQLLMEELMECYPLLARNYICYLSGRIRFLNGKIEGLIAGSAERRLAQYLLERLEGDCVELDCSITDLARRLNVSRASLYRVFDALTEAGAVVRRGKILQVLNMDALRHSVS